MIYVAGISIAFFLGLLLLSKKKKTQADRILTCWLLCIGIHLLLFYLFFSGTVYQYPYLLGLDLPMPLLHGPFLFLYTASLSNQLNSNKTTWLLHFIPAAVSWLYLTRFYTLPTEQKIFIFQHKGIGFESFQQVNLAAIILSGIAYVIYCIRLLKQHRKNILHQFSSTEKINLQWLQYLVYGIALIWLLIFATDEVLFGGVVLFVLFMGYFGIRQVGIFTAAVHVHPLPSTVAAIAASAEHTATAAPVLHKAFEQKPAITSSASVGQESSVIFNADEAGEKKKYLKSGLTEEMAENLHRRLTHLMDTEKVYTESELSLAELAERLDTLPNYLSQIINEREGKTFYDYINTLRIEEFKKLVSIPENKRYTLLSLSYDCGFNSKSSFNKNFKKATGLSPSEYLNTLNQEADWNKSSVLI